MMVYERGDVIREVWSMSVSIAPSVSGGSSTGFPVAVPAVRHQRVEHRLQRHVRLGLEPIDDRAAELFQRPDDLGPVLRRPGVARAHHDYRLAVHVLGQERQWRRELELDDRRELVGRGSRELAIEPQYLRRVFERVEDRPGEHDRPDRMQAVLERRDDAEVTRRRRALPRTDRGSRSRWR